VVKHLHSNAASWVLSPTPQKRKKGRREGRKRNGATEVLMSHAPV
jgi:hypothetical protein